MTSGAVTLGDVAGEMRLLEVACARCGRHGMLSIARLIKQHGADAKLPDLRATLAGDCSRVTATAIYERCQVQYPQLVTGRPGHVYL